MHLTGRDAELAHLDQAWRSAAARPGAVLIGGTAGIGKSALVNAFADKTAATVLRGAVPDQGADALPYAPFVAALSDPAPLDPDRPRTAVYGDVLERLEAAAPAILVLEDLHRADQASRALLAYLIPALRRPGLLILATYRDGDDPALGLLTAGLGGLPYVDRLTPAPLTEPAVAALLAGRMRRRPAAAVVADVCRRSAGNPLFVEALADAGPDLDAPLDEILLVPFRALPPDSRAAVRTAAILGRDVDTTLLTHIAGPPDKLLRPAVERGILVVRDGGYRFRHELIRDAVYNDLRPAERVGLHRLAALAVDAGLGAPPAPAALVRSADHWAAAGETERAFGAAWRAAAVAGAAHSGRLRLLERVVTTWDKVAVPAVRTNTDRAAVLTAAAVAALHAGEYTRGVELTDGALGATGDPTRRALLFETRSLLLHRSGRDGVADLRTALALLPANNRIRATLAGRLELPARAAEARALATEAANATDPAVRALALVTLATAAADPGRGADPTATGSAGAVALAREAAGLAQQSGDDDTELLARTVEAAALEAAGDSRAAAESAGSGIAAARRAGLLPARGAALATTLAASLTALGEWPRARAVIAEALAWGPPPLHRAMLTTAAGWLDAVTGDPGAAADKARTAADLLDELNAGRQHLIALWELRALLGEAPPFDHLPLGDHPAAAWSLLLTSPAPRVARRVPVNGLVQRAASLTLAGRWREAIAAWRSVGHPYRLAHTLLRAANAARDRATAATLARESAALAERLGARPLAQEAAALLASGRASANELTDRETEVVRLLAGGRTNKQIAEILTISPKTASVHVTNILGKLGVNTRGDAATVAKRRGLLGP